MKRGLLSLLTMACLLAAPAAARADVVVHYIDPHPLPPQLHKGMCFIEGPHVHAYQPHKTVLYIKRAGGYTFVGDPVEFEPSGPRHAYHGHHPVFWIDDDPAVAIQYLRVLTQRVENASRCRQGLTPVERGTDG